jgi:hypothetical protein
MSIQQVSNNRPSGSAALACDAGIPIVGRTSSTGTYEILKVNADGSLPFASSNGTFVSGVPTSDTPIAGANPTTGIKAVDLVLAYNLVTPTPLTAGVYRINPFFICSATVLGAVDMMLIKAGSPLDAYTATRAAFVDGFSPSITDFADGFAVFFNNVANVNMGGNNALAYNRTNQIDVYLEAGSYELLVKVHTAITMTAGAVYSGFYNFALL